MRNFLIAILVSISINTIAQDYVEKDTTNASANTNLQDVIYLKNGGVIRGTIIENVPGAAIKIKTYDNSIFVYEMEEVLKVEKEIDPIKEAEEKARKEDQETMELNYQASKGRIDAKTYYRGYRGAQAGTFFLSLAGGPLGLIPAVACTKRAPKSNLFNKRYTHPEYMDNPEYAKAYKQRAHSMKKIKVWTMFGIGFGINVLVLYSVTMALTAQ